jgi:hypothetical protein
MNFHPDQRGTFSRWICESDEKWGRGCTGITAWWAQDSRVTGFRFSCFQSPTPLQTRDGRKANRSGHKALTQLRRLHTVFADEWVSSLTCTTLATSPSQRLVVNRVPPAASCPTVEFFWYGEHSRLQTVIPMYCRKRHERSRIASSLRWPTPAAWLSDVLYHAIRDQHEVRGATWDAE